MKYLLLLICTLSFSIGFSQNLEKSDKSVPTFNGSDIKWNKTQKLDDIANKTIKHIEQKTDSVFLRRLGLKEHDSIGFAIKYWVLANGTTPLDSVSVDTGVKSLDNYMKLMINSLPKFIPAQDPETEKNSDYQISMEAKFTVADKKLKAIYKEQSWGTDFFPILLSCQDKKSDATKKNCTYKALHERIFSNLDEYFPQDITSLRMFIRITINQEGTVEDVKILRSAITSKDFQDRVIANVKNLPKFHVPKGPEYSKTMTCILPVSIQLGGNESYSRENRDHYQNNNSNNWPQHIRRRN